MIKSIDYKVPNGKMLRIDAEIEGGAITSFRLTGDFFIHPEEAISDIEESVVGSALVRGELIGRLSGAVAARRARLVGLSVEDIADSLMRIATEKQ